MHDNIFKLPDLYSKAFFKSATTRYPIIFKDGTIYGFLEFK